MQKILSALGGVAIGVAAYKLGELVQKQRQIKGEGFDVLDLIQELTQDLNQDEQDTQEKE